MSVSESLNLALRRSDWPRAKKLLQHISKRAPKDPQVWFLLGAVNGALGDLPGVVKATRKSLELKPDNPEALFNLANALHELGRQADALRPLQRLLVLQPRQANALVLMGNIQDELGEPLAAISNFQTAIDVDPDLVEAHANLAKVLASQGDTVKAAQSYLAALSRRPDDDAVLYALVLLWARDGDVDAIHRLLEHVKLPPDSVGEAVMRSVLMDKQGETQQAWQVLLPFIDASHPSLAVSLQFASVCHHGNDCARAASRLRGELARAHLPRDRAMHIEHALARVLDVLAEYPEAFAHVSRFNAMKYAALPETARYRPKAFERFIDGLIRVFPAGEVRSAQPVAAMPVFIVGMPRSGTSLVEQMLAMHPAVFAGGERMDIPALVAGLSAGAGGEGGSGRYPEVVPAIAQTERTRAIRDYRESIDRLRGDAYWTTDKLPQNFLHLGLIAELLPEARIIHCLRSPLDTCVSIFMQGFNAEHSYAFQLPSLAHYYVQYERLMAHWRRCPQIRMHEVVYEEMVADPEANARAMAEFLGLPWDAAMLEFHRNKRLVNTASYDQVRRPIYTDSVGRWRRYGDAVKPLIGLLGAR